MDVNEFEAKVCESGKRFADDAEPREFSTPTDLE
jgi:hypothetical protein